MKGNKSHNVLFCIRPREIKYCSTCWAQKSERQFAQSSLAVYWTWCGSPRRRMVKEIFTLSRRASYGLLTNAHSGLKAQCASMITFSPPQLTFGLMIFCSDEFFFHVAIWRILLPELGEHYQIKYLQRSERMCINPQAKINFPVSRKSLQHICFELAITVAKVERLVSQHRSNGWKVFILSKSNIKTTWVLWSCELYLPLETFQNITFDKLSLHFTFRFRINFISLNISFYRFIW